MRDRWFVVIILTVGILFTVSPVLLADGVDVQFGLQGGANIAKAIYDPSDYFGETELENNFRTLFGGGGIVSLTFTGRNILSLESGLLLNMKGGKTHLAFEYEFSFHPDPDKYEFYMEYKLLYLTIPLHARVSLTHSRIKPYVKAGFDFDILLSAKVTETQRHLGTTSERKYDAKDSMKSIDFALVGGAGVEVAVKRARIYVEGTYLYGLIDILDPEEALFDVKLHNRVIGIVAGIRF